MNIVKATKNHINDVASLFDLYRQFYDCEPDANLAKQFIGARIENHESEIFVALESKNALGFVQLYPSFCSVDAIKIYILYDLYVVSDHRNLGIGRQLMCRASEWAASNGASRVDLLTERTNYAGQHLYKKLGYHQTNENFDAYSLDLSA